MPRKTSAASSSIYQIKVTLRGIRPPIWRRVLIPSDTSLEKVHQILQIVMGWWGGHLHQFVVGETYYGVPHPDFGMEDIRNERPVRLSQVLRVPKDTIVYEYDFGDDWKHVLLLEKVLPPDPSVHYPICVTGKRACPPEDCGGTWGYAELLEIIASPDHPEYAERLEWIGDDFDPEAFDLNDVNARLTSGT